MKKTPLQIANEKELEDLRKIHNKLRRIITKDGFCSEWFNTVSPTKNGVQAFNELNEFYYNNVIPPKFRYSSYNAFLTVLKKNK